MTPDELLWWHPRETVRWLRGQLSVSQPGLAARVGVRPHAVSTWETRHKAIGPASRERLAALLAPYLATPEGEAFAQSLRRDEATETLGEGG